jgi:hypothetical protein
VISYLLVLLYSSCVMIDFYFKQVGWVTAINGLFLVYFLSRIWRQNHPLDPMAAYDGTIGIGLNIHFTRYIDCGVKITCTGDYHWLAFHLPFLTIAFGYDHHKLFDDKSESEP